MNEDIEIKKINDISSRTKHFIEKAKEKFGDKYDYSFANYINDRTKIKIRCIKDDYIFEQIPRNHLAGKNGCPFCSKNPVYTQKSFIDKCKFIHKNKYDYSKTVFVGIKNSIIIVCPIHGDFEISADHHINRKVGCPCCSGAKYNQKSFIDKCKLIHKNKYDYSKTVFTGVKNEIIIICPVHGVFKQKAYKHLEGQGCKHCSKSTEEFKKEMESIDKNIEILGDYRDAQTKIKIKCLKCGCETKRKPTDLLKGYGCYYCKSSVLERFTEKWLIKNKIKYNREKTFKDCKDKSFLPFDFYIDDMKICIECQGKQHYIWQKLLQPTLHDFHKQLHHDWLKRKFCRNNGIKLVTIPYWEFSSWKNNNIDKILKEHING